MEDIRGVAIFATACFGHPSPSKQQKSRDRSCLRRPSRPAVFALTQPGVKASVHNDSTRCRIALHFPYANSASGKRPALSLLGTTRLPASQRLAVYKRSYDATHPLICMDESSKQQIKEVRQSIPAKPGSVEKYDTEYERNGVSHLFMFFDPLAGQRHVAVTDQRSTINARRWTGRTKLNSWSMGFTLRLSALPW